jgi:hypothetical protein
MDDRVAETAMGPLALTVPGDLFADHHPDGQTDS